MFGFLMCMSILIPGSMLVIGLAWRKHPPKTINPVFGYRSSMSMKNKKTWDFAHHYCAKIWVIWGLVLIILSAVVMLLYREKDYETASVYLTVVQIIVMCLSIIPTERALRKRFDKNGRERA